MAHEALSPIAYTVDGEPLGYATPRQMRFIEWLSERAHFVPVTARSLDALRRVRLRFAAAVCAHGGVVLGDDGEPDPGWAVHIAGAAADAAPVLERLANAVREQAAARGDSLRVRVLTEGAVPLYVLVKHADADEAALNGAVDAILGEVPPDWTVHRNGNNVALMPPFLGKAAAVAYLLPRLRARFADASVVGVGDSLTDAPFMALCDYAMMPTGSQLAAAALHGLG